MSVLQGGKFGHGFIAAGVVKGYSSLQVAAADSSGIIGGTIVAAYDVAVQLLKLRVVSLQMVQRQLLSSFNVFMH